MAALAAAARGGGSGPLDMADLSRALPAGGSARASVRVQSDGSVGSRSPLRRLAASSDALHDPASGMEAVNAALNGHQNDSAPVSRASSTNSALLQGQRIKLLCLLQTQATRHQLRSSFGVGHYANLAPRASSSCQVSDAVIHPAVRTLCTTLAMLPTQRSA